MPKQAILLINGEIDLQFCEEYVHDNLSDIPIYCADGAFNHIKDVSNLVAKVNMVIGDGDSMKNSRLFNIPYQQYDDQYSTDFDKALHWLYQKNYRLLFLFGFGGGEMDHYLGNVSTLLKYQHQFQFVAIDRYGFSQLLHKNMLLSNVRGKMISIVPLFELKNLILKGFAFDLDRCTLRFGEALGIRNHAVQDDVFIDYESGNGLLFRSHTHYHRFNAN